MGRRHNFSFDTKSIINDMTLVLAMAEASVCLSAWMQRCKLQDHEIYTVASLED